MDKLRIVGPCRLEGEIQAAGAKNAALPALAASLLTEETVALSRVPGVQDLRTMRKLLEHLGVESSLSEGVLELRHVVPSELDDAPYDLVKTMRASVLVLGPLVARLGHARVSLPGGCAIGSRPIDQHLAGLEALGAEITLDHGYVTARTRSNRSGGPGRLRGARVRFNSPTVGGTENLLMAATLAEGTTILENCAQEPEIRDLGQLLTKMGAQISGAGESTIEIEGVESLSGARHTILADRIEVGTYLIGAAMTAGRVSVRDAIAADLAPLLEQLTECGCEVEIGDRAVTVARTAELRPRNIVTAPHPGFPTDLQAQYLALMTQATGPSTVCETVFENRFQHVPELRRMGAEIEVDGNVARIKGPVQLTGAKVMATDLRASACLVLAALAAEGESVIDRIYHLDRGYEPMELKLHLLGTERRVERTS
ncbi:MAG: UDP-N-acetylglucosamine 1-carboxyvinyltransferase [bacterium]|nr:UDP-N-acetylglucosamine 1-carboxyvinyltransferase [bacterium]